MHVGITHVVVAVIADVRELCYRCILITQTETERGSAIAKKHSVSHARRFLKEILELEERTEGREKEPPFQNVCVYGPVQGGPAPK